MPVTATEGGGLVRRALAALQAQVGARRHAERQATHDPLTGLPNRRRITAEIDRLLAAVRRDGEGRVWVYLLDLDGFRRINDSWGHDAGDRLVLQVAGRLRGAVPRGGTLARVGGDEFVLVHRAGHSPDPPAVDGITACLARPLPGSHPAVVVSASIGVASAAAGDPDAVSAAALLRDAGTALQRAKAEGPGRVTVFDAAAHDAIRGRAELTAALRCAVAGDQLQVAYQPIVDVCTGHPLGAEALARWDHPERGPIPPSVFIPVAEDAGMITTIGAFVLQAAIRQLSVWRASGIVADDFQMSINVSPHQLCDTDLPALVAAELTRYDVPPALVVLEITESVLVGSPVAADRVLTRLRELGVRLVVDDAGTTSASPGHLRWLPVTGVKIDQSVVDRLGDGDAEDRVRAIVATSRALALSIVAEGVETQRQRNALAGLGVPFGQGWLWGRAVPADQFASRWGALIPPPDRPEPQAPTVTVQPPHTAPLDRAG